MNYIRPNILGYHSNDYKKINNFMTNKNLIIHEDTTWLGTGMYFWDNISNAYYWKNEKIRKNESKNVKIIKANLYLDNMLDLTNRDTLEKITTLYERLSTKDSIRFKNIAKNHLGKKLDLFFEMFPEIFNYTVIKALGKYKKNLISTFDFFQDTNICIENKIIYSVKKIEYIVNPEIMDDLEV